MKLNAGPGVDLLLRVVEPSDAGYLYSLRVNPAFNQYLSEAPSSESAQEQWIVGYKTREAMGTEYYFVAENSAGIRCGCVRIYAIMDDAFAWGSWILDENKPAKAALRSAIGVYDLAFRQLGKTTANFEVSHGNDRVKDFHRRFGATETGDDAQSTHFTFSQLDYERVRDERWRSCLSTPV